jgi:branched-chain amino acid transport system substrate-binding protein
MSRVTRLVALLAVMTLVGTACGSDDDNGGSTAAACSTSKLSGLAAGAPSAELPSVTSAAGRVVPLAAEGDTYRIGLFGDLTGANSGLTKHEKQGAELAIEQANASGKLKVKLELVAKDNKDASADTAPAIEQSFIDDPKVVGVIGGLFSGETLAVGNLFAAAGLAHVSPSATNPEITTKGWPFFRALSTDAVQGARIAKLLKGIGCTGIAVIDDETDYGKGLGDIVESEAKAAGLTVEVRQSAAQKTTDYGPLIDTLKSKNIKGVAYTGYYNDGSLFWKQAKEKGLDAVFICGDGCKDEGFITGATATHAEGALFTCPCGDPNVADDPESQKFAADYEKKFGEKVGIYGAEAYDVANIFVAAVDASDEDGVVTRAEILAFLKTGLKDLKGITKTFNFDDKGEVAGGVVIAYGVKDGKIVVLGEIGDDGSVS